MGIDNILHLYKEMYYSLPQSVKTFLGTIYGNIPLEIRFGNVYSKQLEIVEKYENATDQFKLDFLYNKTLETITFAEKYIPYYKKIFQEYGVSASSFKDLKDIEKFPYLTKDDIKQNLQDMYVDIIEKPTPYFTGGSTSSPTKYYLPLHTSRAKEKAYNNFIFSKIGYKYRDRTVLLKGRDVANIDKKIFWEYEPVDNYLVVSNSYLNSEYFMLIYNKISSFKPKFFFGYPSAVIEFIKVAKKLNVIIPNIKGVILASEMIFEDELKLIKDYFDCDIIIHYGHTERAVIAYNKNNVGYKFLNSYGLSRIVDNEIVVTGFDNFVMPFINYKTNDYTSDEVKFLPGTDVSYWANNIEGRLQEYLVTKDKRLISICVMGAGHYSSLSTVDAIQYKQDKIGVVTLLVESKKRIDKESIKEQLESFCKKAIKFQIKQVDYIPKSSRGKRIMCKQSLNIQKFRNV